MKTVYATSIRAVFNLCVSTMLGAELLKSPHANATPVFNDVFFAEQHSDNESIIRRIIHSEAFYRPWAMLAHYLGYGWCGGNSNGNMSVGKEFDYRRIRSRLDDISMSDNQYRYMLSARFDPEGPSGYWSDKRFRMAFTNLQWLTESKDLLMGTPQLFDRKPIKVVTVLLENDSDQIDTAVANLKYDASVSWSKADKISVSGKVTVAQKFKAGLPLLGETETSIGVEMAAGADWTTTNGYSATTSQTAEYRATLPPRSKRQITLTLFEQNASIPYESNMYLKYDAELFGFLRFTGNALENHPTHRPFVLTKFGGKDGLSAPQDLLSQYKNPETSSWDWRWVTNTYTRNRLEHQINAISKRKFRQQFSGVFTTSNSTGYQITASQIEPLGKKKEITAKLLPSQGIHYTLLSDLMVPNGKASNLRFSIHREARSASSASPF